MGLRIQREWGLMDEQLADQSVAPEVYANSARVAISVYDFAIMFGLGGEGKEAVTRVTVRMSPQHAKSLLILLERFVGLYEAQMSPIDLPDGLVAMLQGKATGPTEEKGN